MHLDKIANGAECSLLQHNARTHAAHANKNIDAARTHLNYNLTTYADGETPERRFQNRLGELSYRRQRNNVRMESIVITAPKNLSGVENTARFFKAAHRALQTLTGGQRNEVCSWVHMDETTPHMHYTFVPGITVDGVPKLSAKRLMDRDKLKVLHPTVQRAVDREFGTHEYIIVADNLADRQQTSDTLAAYKRKMEHIDKLDMELGAAENALNALEADLAAVEEDRDTAAEERDSLQREINVARHKLADVRHDLQIDSEQLDKYTFYEYLAGAVEDEYPEYYMDILSDWKQERAEQAERAEQYYQRHADTELEL